MKPKRFLVVACVWFLWATSSSGLKAQSSFDFVLNNGPSANRVDMIFVGDGYQAHEIDGSYSSDVQAALNTFFDSASTSSPLNRYSKFFNAYQVNVVSNESGTDRPGDGVFVDTALDSGFGLNGGPDRLLTMDTNKAAQHAIGSLQNTGAENDGFLMGLVNTDHYGGSGGLFAVYSAKNSLAGQIALHEIGHTYAGLADEYTYGSEGIYSGGEFSQWNVTNDPASGK